MFGERACSKHSLTSGYGIEGIGIAHLADDHVESDPVILLLKNLGKR